MITPSYKATGCGCGSGGTLSAAPCGCGGGECDSCQGQGIVRPRFFAGQLLTEDDLQLLTDYVGHKNRLHNRHLFGAGVVCGLEVTCHPCGDGRVIVHPGYALDCCGNDLTLACAQTLDINAMVRSLRRDQLGGFDCGDPCPDPEKLAAARPGKAPGAGGSEQGAAQDAPKTELRYCLYLRYCEQPSDPVMPYSTGEDCGRASCEPTRVREGVKFELRCRPRADAANEMLARLCACLGDLNRLPAIFDLVGRMRRGNRVVSNTLVKRRDEAFDPANLRVAVQRFETLRVEPAAAPAAAPEREAALKGRDSRAAAGVAGGPEYLNALRELSTHARGFERLSAEDQQGLPAADREAARKAGEVVGLTIDRTVAESASAFREVRDWLIERLSNSPFVTDCTLRQRVFALILPTTRGRIGDGDTRSLVASVDELTEAVVSFVRDCVCRALNPPCLPCDDAGVLLACLDVEDCEVVKVCNLERSYVMSPAAVRYWLPPAQLLGNVLERLCCEPLDRLFGDWNDQYGSGRDEPDIATILREEITRMLEDSLCVTGRGQAGPLQELLGRILPPASRNVAPPPPTSTLPGAAGGERSPQSPEPKAGAAEADEADASAQEASAPPAASKRVRAAAKGRAAKPQSETAAAAPADAAPTNASAGGEAGGAATNGGKNGGSKGGVK